MKKITFVLFLLFIFVSSANAYVDMSDTYSRSLGLNMKRSDYSFAMAITGSLTGTMLGLFLWKTK
ncbi:MAG: ABC-type Fe3+-siderophore transport system permease subunit [Clostridium sp.]|jgi:ABC-type Fe3+-siderophore transport system permease subunit